MDNNINNVDREGDIFPKYVDKLESHSKRKNKDVARYLTEQKNFKQTKNTTIKGYKST